MFLGLVFAVLAAAQQPARDTLTDVDVFFRRHHEDAMIILMDVATGSQLNALRDVIADLEAADRLAQHRAALVVLPGIDENSAVVTEATVEDFAFTPSLEELPTLFRKHYWDLRPLIAADLSANQKAELLERCRMNIRWRALVKQKARALSLGFDVGPVFETEITFSTPSLTVIS